MFQYCPILDFLKRAISLRKTLGAVDFEISCGKIQCQDILELLRVLHPSSYDYRLSYKKWQSSEDLIADLECERVRYY